MKNFVSRLNIVDSVFKPIISCHNVSIVFYFNNNETSSGSKHNEFIYVIVKDKNKVGQIVIEHINPEVMIVDQLTRGLAPKLSNQHVINMGLLIFFICWDNRITVYMYL